MHTGTLINARSQLPTTHMFALLVLLFVSTFAAAEQTPQKSPNDNNLYRFIELHNGLRAILVSDKGADKAAASMNVAVGSGDDPKDREGISHFLEHMLFLGTDKYPQPGEYQQFITSHGGSHNAFTAFRNTNYFFDIQANHLESALDRFAQQFSAPLFTAELVNRERNAVHSEFSAKQKEDGRRFYSVKKAASNPEHAFHQFAVGNLTTLENTGENPLRPDLIEFWKNHYSANLMTLAVYGPQPLDKLEAMVRSRFNSIENRNLQPKTHTASLLQANSLPAKVTVEAIKDVRSLSLSFPIPSQQKNYRTKPASYIANLLGHEGPGSLFDVLKKNGLADSLSAGIGMDTGDSATLEISIALTPEGLNKHEEILSLVFRYIDLIRENGISQQRFEEMQRLAQIDFRFREQGDPVHEAMRLSSQLQDYPADDILSAPWLMERYAPDQYRAILDKLTPNNVMVYVLEPQPKLNNPKLSQWYETPWQMEPLGAETISANAPDTLVKALRLPLPNPFVPENLSMVPGKTMTKPELLRDKGVAIWFARDTRFDTPKASVFFSLRTPAARVSARSHVLTQLLVDSINTNLNAWAYSARLAGLDYSIYPHLRGITVRVSGYNDKLHTLMNRILIQISAPEITKQRFGIARQNLIDSLQNKAKDRPVAQTSEFVQTAVLEDTWSTEDKLKAARSVTLDELMSFTEALLSEVDPVLLAHGNITEAYALNLAQQINAIVLGKSEFKPVERSHVRKLPADEMLVSLNVEHPDTGYTLYTQGKNTSFEERARFRLLAQIISSPFYEEIRTTRQLGYIVYATPFEMLETPALGFVVQSPTASAGEIDQAVREFTKEFEKTLGNLTGKRLEREKQAVISSLLEQDRQLGEISGRYWQEIDRGSDSFDSREKLAKAVEAVSLEELKNTFTDAVLNRDQALRAATGPKGISPNAARDIILKQPPVTAK